MNIMSKYELAVLVKPLLPEDVREKVMPAVNETIVKLGGNSKLGQDWGKKHLAYPIKGHEEGYYFFLEVDIDPINVTRLERELKLMRDLLRVMIIKEDQI